MIANLSTENPMTANEARAQTESARGHYLEAEKRLKSAYQILSEIYHRGGHRALGYADWKTYLKTEFQFSKSQLYRLVDAMDIEDSLGITGEVPERVLRPLAPYEPEVRRALYAVATQFAGENRVTSGVMEEVINTLGEALVTGTTTDGEGLQTDLYQRLDADVAARMFELAQRQKEHIKAKPRDYLAQNAPVDFALVDGRLTVMLPLNAEQNLNLSLFNRPRLRVSIWVEESPDENDNNDHSAR